MAEGDCSAFMAEAAEGLGPADAMDCGPAVDMPEMGSVFEGGHSPRGAFLRAAKVDPSPAGAGPTPCVCEDEVEMVEVAEAVDDKDDDEFARCRLLRGMLNIL
jgi:hypothetical protein